VKTKFEHHAGSLHTKKNKAGKCVNFQIMSLCVHDWL